VDFETIGEVVQTDELSDVNQRLQDGWVILAIATGHRADGEPRFAYSMGLPYEDDEEDEDEDEEEEGDE